MISESTRQFDLYDFFSVLIPGAVFLLAVFPFLPEDTDIFSTGLILAVILVGFVIGRAIHAMLLLIDEFYGATSHRDTFVKEVSEPVKITEGLADTFYEKATDAFSSLNLPDDQSKLSGDDRDSLEDLYSLVRSAIHMDTRGRSRTFQAVFDFYRCMMTTCALLFAIYTVYTIVLLLEIASDSWIGYTTYIGSLEPSPAILFFGASFVFLLPFTVFRHVRSGYRIFNT